MSAKSISRFVFQPSKRYSSVRMQQGRVILDSDWNESERTSVIEARMLGALLEEHFKTGNGTEILRTFSYDRFSETYRMTQITSRTTHLDVREGGLSDDGRLTVSNVETGTTQLVRGGGNDPACTHVHIRHPRERLPDGNGSLH